MQKITSSRLGARIFSRVAHHLDLLLHRLTGGRVASVAPWLLGTPAAVLHTVGARSGQPRSVPLLVLPEGDGVAVLASNWGQSRHPSWYHNLLAHPEAELEIAGVRTPCRARTVTDPEERRSLWNRACALYPGYDLYQGRTGGREIPILMLEPL